MVVFIAVVTGGSDGIGLEYAKELAQRSMNIVLISRNPDKLKKAAIEIGLSLHIYYTGFKLGPDSREK